jgi:hypothetical protein
VIHYPSARDRRIDPQPHGVGAVVEAAGDGTIGGRVWLTGSDGRISEFDLADQGSIDQFRQRTRIEMQEECPPETCGEEGGGGGGGNGNCCNVGGSLGRTWVHAIETEDICDDGPVICGDNEFEFRATWSFNSVSITDVARITGVPSDDEMINLNKTMIMRRPYSPFTLAVDAVETDAPFGDDQWGPELIMWNALTQTLTWPFGEFPDYYNTRLVVVFKWE